MDIKYPSPMRSGVCMLYISDSMASAARVLMIFCGVTMFDMQLMMAVLAVWSKNNIKGIANGIANAVSSASATSVVLVVFVGYGCLYDIIEFNITLLCFFQSKHLLRHSYLTLFKTYEVP